MSECQTIGYCGQLLLAGVPTANLNPVSFRCTGRAVEVQLVVSAYCSHSGCHDERTGSQWTEIQQLPADQLVPAVLQS